MNKKFLIIFACIFNTSYGMNTANQQLTPLQKMSADLNSYLFDTQIDQAVQVCKPYSSDQKDLIRYVLTISRVSKHYHGYINSSKYIQKLFKQLPYEVKFPFADCLIEKALDSNCYAIDDVLEWIKDFGPKEKQTAVQKYCSPSVDLCVNIFSYNIEHIKQLLTEGADPDFYMDLGHVTCNIPPVLIKLANIRSDENQQKLTLLLSQGADVNIESSIGFMLAYDDVCDSCLCNNPTPLAVAVAYGNEQAIPEILKYKPIKLHFNQVFLSKNSTIKQCMMTYPSITQKDLDLGLATALTTQNIDDVALLLERGANPQLRLQETIDRTIDYCLNPELYKDFNSLSANPGSDTFRGYDFERSQPPIPNTQLVKELCNHGAYDKKSIEKLKKLHATTEALIKMLEANKPS